MRPRVRRRVPGRVLAPRVRRRALAAAVLALLVASCDGAAAPGRNPTPTSPVPDRFGSVTIEAGEPIVLGTLLATGGANAELGLDSLRGVQLAVDYLDGEFDGVAGPLLGHPVELLNRQGGCGAGDGETAARDLALDPQVVGVVGTTCAGPDTGDADRILSERGVLLVSPSNTSPALTAPGRHQPFSMRVAYNDDIEAAVMADFAYEELEARTAAILHDPGPYAESLAAAFRRRFEEAGGTVAWTQTVTDTGTSVRDGLVQVGEFAPDVLYAPNLEPLCSSLADQRFGVGARGAPTLLGAAGCLTSTYLDAGGGGASGNYLAGPDLAEIAQDDFYTTALLPAYEDQFGLAPTAAFHAHAYDAAYLLFDAIDTSAIVGDDGSLRIDRAALREAAFATDGYLGLTGELSCTPSGECATDVAIAIYRAPAIPFEGGDPEAEPVFAESITLDTLAG